MNKDETEAWVQRFVGYARELSDPNVKPVPPFLFEISKDSRDHSREVYEEVIMPGFRKMSPAPKIALTRFGAGGHNFWKARKRLTNTVQLRQFKLRSSPQPQRDPIQAHFDERSGHRPCWAMDRGSCWFEL